MIRMTLIAAATIAVALVMSPAPAAEMKDDPGMKHTPGMKMDSGKGTVEQTHAGQGTVNSIDVKTGTVKLAHGPIPTLKWPAMTMDFAVSDRKTLATVKPGQKVDFKLVEKSKGQYVISEIRPMQ